ncbi:MAG TPA: peptide chain release factor N(5)-glutamine methyltransferase [Longimicrobiales bacterium]|nr:peptide chain release factor N(5)-glutamine methyltransferase [Longimicrobiales bacterium]
MSGGARPAAAARGFAGSDEPWTVLRLMLWSADYLARKGVERARLDAEYLLAHVLGVGRLEMYMQHERPLEPAELDAFRPLLQRRAAREPLQYILGRQAFRDLDLEVGPGVLIPRPETEQLVEVVLGWARARAREGLIALDIGTGSGAIALALLTEGPFERVVATDPSPAALALAARNGADHAVGDRLELRSGRYYDPVAAGERFDVVVSNPPYVAEGQRTTLAPEIAEWEPAEALFAGPDGLDALRRIVEGAPSVLRPGGLLALEVGDGQADTVAALVRDCGGCREVAVHRDLAGKERVVAASLVLDDHS